MIRYRVDLVVHGVSRDVVLVLPDDPKGADLFVALQHLGINIAEIYCDGRRVRPETDLGAGVLQHGSLVADRPGRTSEDLEPGKRVVVVSGPDAGLTTQLTVGQPATVGRLSGDLVVKRDHLMSARHLEILWDGDQVSLRDLASANGSLVEGKPVPPLEPVSVTDGAFIHAGSSVIAVVDVEPNEIARMGTPAGATIAFPRSFRAALPELPESVPWPEKRRNLDEVERASTFRAIAPLFTTVGFLFLFMTRSTTVRIIVMALAAVGPAYLAIDTLRRNRRKEAQLRLEEGELENAIDETRRRIDALRAQERSRRRDSCPFGGVATTFSSLRHRRLWERRPSDDDFLSVTIGLAALPSAIQPSAGRDVTTGVEEDVWGLPVNVDLRATGSLAIIGALERARSVARGMLFALSASHSPSELQCWLFAPDGAESAWSFTRWLPHFMRDDVTARVAVSAMGRSDLWNALRQELDARHERLADRKDVPLPVNVVVIDGADLMAETEVADLLHRGLECGIVGVVIDTTRSPEGIMGSLILGEAADEAEFQSRYQPKVASVLTAEMSNEVAADAARRMAALSPSIVGPRTLDVMSRRLVDCLGSWATDPSSMVQGWNANGSTTRVAVGSAAESLFFVDIVANGPHGLIGGATRSGKTEFIKSLVMSLAAHNHPDDLNFVIVDFKGGIDYVSVSRLPHVLEVSSNQDLDRFERTVIMLMAEHERRQALFTENNVVNLDAYRAARAQRPRLPAVPRLVVLVDEFGELQSSDVGRAQMHKLESVTRIGAGLGVNLVLVTQNFDGQLPDQIAANTGLRICFRVQEPRHSKVLLGTGIASTLDPRLIGRGFAQFKGADPFEFQGARVAGRRRDLEGGGPGATALLRPLGVMFTSIAEEVASDPPDEETDMFALIETISEAARLAGWERSPVPWPEVLPQDVALEEASPPNVSATGRLPWGLLDRPGQQRRVPRPLGLDDGHILLLGGQQADLQHAITMIGVAAAATASVDDLHVYGIDLAGRGLERLTALPHCGGVANRNDALALRILEHLGAEVARRRSSMTARGATTLEELARRGGETFPRIWLLVASADRMLASANGGVASPIVDPLTALVADSAGLGVQVVLAGTPPLASQRPGMSISRRFVFRCSDQSDAVALGVSRTLVADLDGPRKFVDVDLQCSGVVASIAGGGVPEEEAFEALAYRIDERDDPILFHRRPRRFREAEWPLSMASFRRSLRDSPPHMLRPLPVGIDTVTGDPIFIDSAEDGPTFSVCGEVDSGRSNALLVLGSLAAAMGWQVVACPLSRASSLNVSRSWYSRVTIDGLAAAVATASEPCVVLIDDFQRPLSEYPNLGSSVARTFMVLSGTPASMDNRNAFRELGMPPPRNGVVLAPRGYADFMGMSGVHRESVRPELLVNRRPGMGVLGIDGQLVPLVIPLMDADREPEQMVGRNR